MKPFSAASLSRLFSPRFLLPAAALIALILLLLFLPRSESIHSMGVVEYAGREQIAPAAPGWLDRWLVHEGSRVTTGQTLAELENPTLANALAQGRLERELAEVQWLSALNAPDEPTRATATALEKTTLEMAEELRDMEQQASGLTVKATRPGIIIMPGMEQEIGQYFPITRLLVQIGDDSGFHVILPLTEQQARQVHSGDRVTVRLRAYPQQPLSGHILTTSTAEVENFSSPLMASTLGGEFPAEAAKQPGELPRPAIPCYEAVVNLDALTSPIALKPGMMGRARIETGSTTWGAWMGERILDWLNPTFRL